MKITGIGSFAPPAILSSAIDLERGFPDGHVERLTGVKCRLRMPISETQIAMGAAAAQAALLDADIAASDVDLIIGAAAVPYQPIPATAPQYQAALNIPDATAFAFDVNATCLSFLIALEICDGLFKTGRYRRALIISSEVASRALPWTDRPDIAGLFGDGAAAVVVEPSESDFFSSFRTFAGSHATCEIRAGGTRYDFHEEAEAFAANSLFDMDGKSLFRLTAEHFVEFLDSFLAQLGWRRDDIDLVVPHQASPLALRHMIKHCGFQQERVVNIVSDVGNQVAASIPFALAGAQSCLRPGGKVLMLGTSAGVSFGAAAMTV